MTTFALQIGEFVRRAKLAPETVVRKVATDLLTGVVLRTPVDTGRARASWAVSTDKASNAAVTFADKDGRQTIVRGQAAIATWKPGDELWITSRLEYIPYLEYGVEGRGPTQKLTESGHSRQAPAGMVRVTVTEFQTYIANAVRSLPE